MRGDFAAHQFDQLIGNGQTQPGAAETAGGGSVGLGKGGEQPRLRLVVHADAVVDDAEFHRDPLRRALHQQSPHRDTAQARFAAGEFDRIIDQIDQYLAQAQGVAHQGGRYRRIDEHRQGDVFLLRHVVHQAAHAFHHVGHGQRFAFEFELAGLDLGEIEDVVDDAEQGEG